MPQPEIHEDATREWGWLRADEKRRYRRDLDGFRTLVVSRRHRGFAFTVKPENMEREKQTQRDERAALESWQPPA